MAFLVAASQPAVASSPLAVVAELGGDRQGAGLPSADIAAVAAAVAAESLGSAAVTPRLPMDS